MHVGFTCSWQGSSVSLISISMSDKRLSVYSRREIFWPGFARPAKAPSF